MATIQSLTVSALLVSPSVISVASVVKKEEGASTIQTAGFAAEAIAHCSAH
jgi:hypothetical protein